MEKVYTGKTKDVYQKEDGNLMFYFKDDVTGADGVVDPGANSVMGQIKGKGKMSLELTYHFFKIMQDEGIDTHFVSADLDQSAMEVKATRLPGQHIAKDAGLEFICRCKAYGSFIRRYQKYVQNELQDLNYLVEITLKDDERGDPLINDDTLIALDLLNREQIEKAKDLTRRCAQVVERELSKKELQLIDIKVECGLQGNDIIIIDEVSADSMRVMDNSGNTLSHEELYSKLFPDQ